MEVFGLGIGYRIGSGFERGQILCYPPGVPSYDPGL